MRVLGISDHLVSGAALIEDGRVVAAINEERLVRKKMVMGFPRKSIAAVMQLAGVGPREIDRVAIASHWGHFLDDLVPFDEGVLGVDEGPVKSLFLGAGERLAFLRSRAPALERLYYGLRKPVYEKRKRAIEATLRKEFDLSAPIEYVWHHWAPRCLGLLLLRLRIRAGRHARRLRRRPLLPRLRRDRRALELPPLRAVVRWNRKLLRLRDRPVRLQDGQARGKDHGARRVWDRQAPGDPGTLHPLRRRIHVQRRKRLPERCDRKLRKALPADWKREDLAASIQLLSEDICTRYVAHWARKTGRRRIALAGGVVANVKINQRIHELDEVEEVFVYPAMSDEGLSAGAALLIDAQPPRWSPRGRACFDDVPSNTARRRDGAALCSGVDFAPARSEAIARLTADGRVVPAGDGVRLRALGTVRSSNLMTSANDWRTMAPAHGVHAVCSHHLRGEALLQGDGALDTSRFITITFDCTREMRTSCPGVTHVDGTARPQVVHESDNPDYCRIIREFRKLTGIGSVVNTSFNIHEEPIVCSPEDAIRAFQIGHLDVLALGPFIAKHPDADARVRASRPGRS
jgi:predicted NodU family carbamoyl transferase